MQGFCNVGKERYNRKKVLVVQQQHADMQRFISYLEEVGCTRGCNKVDTLQITN